MVVKLLWRRLSCSSNRVIGRAQLVVERQCLYLEYELVECQPKW